MTTIEMTHYQFVSDLITTHTSDGYTIPVSNLTGTETVDIRRVLSPETELSVDDMFAQIEQYDPRAAAATEVGTKWVVDTFLSQSPTTLATLRMRAGLSQKELGKRLNVSQPQVAKWEKEETPNMQLNTIKNLAKALSIDLLDLISILVEQDSNHANEVQ